MFFIALRGWPINTISQRPHRLLAGNALVVAMLFEGWPAARLRPAPGRVLTVALTALIAFTLDRALAA